MNKISDFFSKPIFYDKRFIATLWFTTALIASAKSIFSGNVNNNYRIFEYVFHHTVDQLNLYAPYPEYYDTNYYGPIFSLIIAPFTFFPDNIGWILWGAFIALTLFIALDKLPLDWKLRVPLFYICVNELYTSIAGMQTNPLIAALIIGSFIAIRKEKDCWATCFIALGFMIKLYGIVGLSFFFFSKHKLKFVGYFFFWVAVFFVLPMIISSPQFIIQSYQDWYQSLIEKNMQNATATALMQDISVMGMIRRISGNPEISNLMVLIPAMIIFALQYLKPRMYGDLRFQLGILASVLLFVVLFSSGSESQTYIIAMSGVAIWFVLQQTPRSKYVILLLIFVMLLTSFSPTDLVPKAARLFVRAYALKALPCFLVWLVLVYQLFRSGYGFRTLEK